MELHEYQKRAMETAVFPAHDLMPIIYPALGLAGETGEVVDKIKKVIRNGGEFTHAIKEEIAFEIGDVLWYIAALATQLEIDMSEIAYMNIAKLQDRKMRNVLKGAGDNR